MSILQAEMLLRETGDPADIARAETLHALLLERGSDVLPAERRTIGVIQAAGALAGGPLLIRTTENAILNVPIGTEVAAIGNAENIREACNIVTRRVYDAFTGEVPNESENRVTRYRHNIKNEGSIGKRSWSHSEINGDLNLRYGFDLSYRIGAKNSLQGVVMSIASQHDSTIDDMSDRGLYRDLEVDSTYPRLGITFGNDSINSMTLTWKHGTPHSLIKLATGNALGATLEEFTVLNDRYYGGSLSFGLTGDTPYVALEQSFSQNTKVGYLTRVRSTFRYNRDPDIDEFIRFDDDIKFHKFLQQTESISDRNSMSSVEFLTLINDVLGLIPTLEI